MTSKKFKIGNSWVAQFELPDEIKITDDEFQQLVSEKPKDRGFFPGPNGVVPLPK